MDKKLLEELDIHEEDKGNIVIALKMKLSEIDQKLGFLDEDSPRALELKELYSRIEKAISECKQEKPAATQKQEWLPREKDTPEMLPIERGKEKASVLGFVNKIKDSLPEISPKETDHERELQKKAKQELAKNKAKQKELRNFEKKQDKKDKQEDSTSNTAGQAQNIPKLSRNFSDGVIAFYGGNMQKAVRLFGEVINEYENTKANKEEAGEACYLLSKIYGDKSKGMYDSPREEFYLDMAAKDLRYPEAMLDYGIKLASNLTSMPGIDDTALKYFERVVESSKSSDKTKNAAKLKYVETCENYRGFKNRCIKKASLYCRDLSKLEKEAFLKQNWVKREKELQKKLRGIPAIKANLVSNIFGNLVSGSLFVIVLLMGNIGYWKCMSWMPGEDLEILDRLPIPFMAESIRLDNPNPYLISFSPFHDEIYVRSDDEIQFFMPFVNLSRFRLTAEEAENITMPEARSVELSAPKAKSISFPESVSEMILCDLEQMSEVTIPEGARSVTLRNCPGLKTIHLPESVTHFEVVDCPSLRKVDAKNQIVDSKISYTYSGEIPDSITVPDGFTTVTIDNLNKQADAISIGDGARDVVVRVGSVDTLSLPATVRNLLLECEGGLTDFMLPEETQEATLRVPSLQQLVLNEGLKKISISNATWTEYMVPETVESVEIKQWENLTSLVVSTARDVDIGSCPNLSKLALPEGMSLEDISMWDCPLLDQ